MPIYFVPFGNQRVSAQLLYIRLPGPKASRESRWLQSLESTSMFQNNKVVTVQLCSCAKRDTNSSIKMEKGLPSYAIISKHIEPNPFLCHPAILGSRKLATCFLSHLFYSQFGIV